MVMHGSDAPPLVRSWDRWRWRPMHPDVPNPIRAYAVTRIGYRRFARPRHPPRTGGPTVGPTEDRVSSVSFLLAYDCPRCPVVAAVVLLYWRVEFSNVMLTPTVDALTQCLSVFFMSYYPNVVYC